LGDEEKVPPAFPWLPKARYAAWLCGLWFVGASAVGFWLLLFAIGWLGARPVGRVIWEPPPVEHATADVSATQRR
jgi:hypothetical protein